MGPNMNQVWTWPNYTELQNEKKIPEEFTLWTKVNFDFVSLANFFLTSYHENFFETFFDF